MADYGMSLNNYQKRTEDTAMYPREINQAYVGLIYAGVGVGGEGGEVADQIKKLIRDQVITDDRALKIIKELGDTLWYVARCAHELQILQEEKHFDLNNYIDLNAIATINLEKLAKRMQKGEIKDDSKR